MCYGIFVKKALLAINICMLLILTASCGKSEQPNAQQESVQQQQSQEKEPEKLKNIESRLETLIETLGGPSIKMEESKDGQSNQQSSQQDSKQGGQQTGSQQGSKQGSQQGSQQQSTQQGGSQQDSQQQGSQQGSQQQGTQQGGSQQGSQQPGTKKQGSQNGTRQNKGGQQQSPQKIDETKWKEVGTLISNLHYQWNEFMPEIAQKGADMKLVNNFADALNSLTKTALTKEPEKTLMSANALYSYIPDIYSLFKVKMSPEVKRMIYFTRNIILEALNENWDQVKKDNDSLGKSWSFFKNTLGKEQQQTGAKLDFSIYELGKVTEEKDQHLTDIKGRIVLSNIQEIEKSFEEKK